jgi:enamine deaminase RidA (YjgF/YER057c/UK114 family)
MKKQIIRTEHAPSSPLYSQGVKVGSTIYVSGMVGMDVATKKLAGDTIQDQTRQALRNCIAIVEAGGASRRTSCRSRCSSRIRPTSRG